MPEGRKTFYLSYRLNGGGRSEPKKRFKLGAFPTLNAKDARESARYWLNEVRNGRDPAAERDKRRETKTVSELIEAFLAHIEAHRKPRTAENYRDMLTRMVEPAIGHLKVDAVKRRDLFKLHKDWGHTPYQANRMLAVVSSMYNWGAYPNDFVAEGFNPTLKIQRYPEKGRVRRLSSEELGRLGKAIREAETVGIPWTIDPTKPGAKHLGPNAHERRTTISPGAAAAIRLLLFTGARLREVLNLKWTQVDLTDGVLALADSKTGPKMIALNEPSIRVLQNLEQTGPYVIPGEDRIEDGVRIARHRADLQRPWDAVTSHAGLKGLRIHDLRHSFATNALSGGEDIFKVSKLLGHADIRTTAKYLHLAIQPFRSASDRTAKTTALAMGEWVEPDA
jgi:integrase